MISIKIHVSEQIQNGSWLRASIIKPVHKTNSQSLEKESHSGSSSIEKQGGDEEVEIHNNFMGNSWN